MLTVPSRILMLSQVRVGPTVERSVADFGDVVGHEIVAQSIALVHRGPKCMRSGLPRQPHRIAKATCEDATPGAIRVELEDRGADRLFGTDIRRRPDRH